ncbi:MAG: hypothetical protein GX074_05270 [Erysipelothrix sp.]|nr:hypothetical protein [Erysipelothrix sp.]
MEHKTKSRIFFPNLILLVTGFIIISISVFSIAKITMTKTKNATVLNSLENEYYIVGKDPTVIQKETFTLLSEELTKEVRDNKEIADLVAQSFVIDFFNWSNKEASYDIGGLQYMYDPTTFNKVAHLEYYQKVDVFNTTYGSENLPTVSNVFSTTTKAPAYLLDGVMKEAYKTNVRWTYLDSKNLKISDFVDECEITLINDNGKISIVEINMFADSVGEFDE